MKDLNGRPFAKLSDCRIGTLLEADGGFDCMDAGELTTVWGNGALYINCREGRHALDGQMDESGYLIGLYHAEPKE